MSAVTDLTAAVARLNASTTAELQAVAAALAASSAANDPDVVAAVAAINSAADNLDAETRALTTNAGNAAAT